MLARSASSWLLKMKLLLCLVGVFILIADVSTNSTPTAHAPHHDIPFVEYCALIANPSLYDGKEIKVHSIYLVSGANDSKFLSSSCDDKIVWVDFDPNYESCSNSKAVKSLAMMRRKSGWRRGRPHVTVIVVSYRSADVEFVGKFTASNPYRKPASPETDAPLLNRSNRENFDFVFNVSCVQRVKPLPKNASY
jgi:hypothetical protein